MHPASEHYIPDGLLAANVLLSGLLAFFGWLNIDKESHSLTGYSPEMLAKRWYEIAAYLGLLFGLMSMTLLFAFRKRLKQGAF